MSAIWRPAVASITAGVLLFLIDVYFLSNCQLLVRFFFNFAEYSFFYFLCWMLLPGGKRILRDTILLIKELKQQKNWRSV